jgi:YggT family protein
MITQLISLAITIYIWLIVARVILSFFQPRTYHPIIRFIYESTEPLLSLCSLNKIHLSNNVNSS